MGTREPVQRLVKAMDTYVPDHPAKAAVGAAATLLVIYTDLEPDDIFAIALQRGLEGRPEDAVCIFTADPARKDSRGVMQLKLEMARAALGSGFVDNLITVEGSGDDGTLPAREAVLEMAAEHIASGAERALASGGCGDEGIAAMEVEVRLMCIAPGRGNLDALCRALRATGLWSSPQIRVSVCMYSGAFNTRLPNTLRCDVTAISALVSEKGFGRPLTDISRYAFARGTKGGALDGICCLCPGLESGLEGCPGRSGGGNPAFAAAWRAFELHFYPPLISPSNGKLFTRAAPLTPDEQRRFDMIASESFEHDPCEYARRLLAAADLMAKVEPFKLTTIRSLAQDSRDGPLCDVLLPLVAWARIANPGWLEWKTGAWVLDSHTGITGTASSKQEQGEEVGQLCAVEQPVLVNPADEAVLAGMREWMEAGILAALANSTS